MASLAILLLARLSGSIAVSPNYYISRSARQMVIASAAPVVIPDTDGQSAQPFLTSPSGSYAAYLRRAVENSAGSLGGDTCYVQIQLQQGGGGGSVWESDCTPVSGADACDLAFSPVGLEIFAGGHSLWDTGVDADPATLSLDDDGDMSILNKEGVTVWKASGEPWTGRQCGAPLPAPSSLSVDALPPPSTASTKLVTPPAAALAGTGTTDFSLGDQLAPPPVDTVSAPDLPAQPPVDAAPEQSLPPPTAGTSPDLPDPSLPPPPAYTSPDSPDQPLAPPPADVLPDQPLYSSPPPAAVGSGPQTSLPPYGFPLAPPPGIGETSPDTPLSGAATPLHGEPGSPGGVPFSTQSPIGVPHKQGSSHHDLPVGAGLPYRHGQPQQGVFGQQPQLLDSEAHPLEDISGRWSK